MNGYICSVSLQCGWLWLNWCTCSIPHEAFELLPHPPQLGSQRKIKQRKETIRRDMKGLRGEPVFCLMHNSKFAITPSYFLKDLNTMTMIPTFDLSNVSNTKTILLVLHFWFLWNSRINCSPLWVPAKKTSITWHPELHEAVKGLSIFRPGKNAGS